MTKLSLFFGNRPVSKELLLDYRDLLLAERKAQTVNGSLSAINAFLDFAGLREHKVRLLKVQRQAFLAETRDLSKEEYERLLKAAQENGNQRLYLLMMTLCGTGIRIGELKYITVEAVRRGRAEISMKGKTGPF